MKDNILGIKLILVILILSLIILLFADIFKIQYEMQYIKSTAIRDKLPYKESFINLIPQDIDTSYSLLNGVLELKDRPKSGSLNSQKCYEGDFQTRIEKTGNYRQLTNNYKRGDPDSCSTPKHEFVNAFYKIEPIN